MHASKGEKQEIKQSNRKKEGIELVNCAPPSALIEQSVCIYLYSISDSITIKRCKSITSDYILKDIQ